MVNERIKLIRVVVGLNQGGVQQMILNLFRGLNRDLFEPIALAIENTGAIGAEIEKAGFSVINLGLNRKSHSFIKIISELYRTFKKERPIIVHASSYYPSVYSRIAAKLAGVPVLVSHEHVVFKKKRPKRQVISHCVSWFTDLHIAVSETVNRQVINWYKIPESKITVVYNGVDTNIFQLKLTQKDAKKRLGIDSNTFVIGCVGRLDPEKRHQDLFQALKILKDKFPMQAVIVGTGRHEKVIIEQAQETDVSGIVKFLGLRRDIPEILSALDVFVLPSIQEGFSNALLEAMAMACPMVAADISENKEAVVNGETGLLFPPGDSGAMASAIEKLLANREKREAMGIAARERVKEKFTIDRHISEIEGLYKRLLRRKGFLA